MRIPTQGLVSVDTTADLVRLGLVLAVLVALAAAVSRVAGLGYSRAQVTAALRATLQLALVGSVIAAVLDSWWLTAGFAALMLAVASVTAGRRVAPPGSRGWIWGFVPICAGAPVEDLVDLGWTTPDEFVTGMDAFATFVVLSLRVDGLTALRFVPVTGEGPGGFGMPHDLTFPGETGTLTLGSTPDPASPTVQVAHTSMATPPAIYDYDVRARTLLLLKAHPVPGVDLSALRETRIWATAPDGVAVPVSLVHHADVRPDRTAAVLLYGYGAYGIPSDPWFSVARLSLLHRGVVFAIAHVRGGTELGWDWYVQGRLEHKPHSFTDFLACADALVDQGWAAADRVAAEGGSAGGLLVAAAATQAPARFRAVLAQVPFVDVLTTMLDPSLPLTVTEQQEWGDPIADPAAYDLIASYSPYETVPVGDFPALLITTSANDTRVFVTEPAKWMARLRDRVTDDPVCRPLLMRTQLTSGHGGRSGRYQAWREIAWEWAVLLDLLGAADQS